MTDSAMFHATLFHMALDLMARTESASLAESLYHRGYAISIINQRLRNHNRYISDGTLVAVACLAQFEVSDFNFALETILKS